ncbi:MAG: DUF4339 domain-containing protein [Anaerolineae bacterium]|nr:DUF4339 domain-containing protein [Phycisphaerae bacterium]
MANDWFYSNQGQQKGPVSLDALRRMKSAGDLALTDMVWRHGLSEWIRAQDAPELASPASSPAVAIPAPAATVDPGVAPAPTPAPLPAGSLNYQSFSSSGEITLTGRAFDMLCKTRPWARLMSIVMFAVAGFMVLGGGFIIVAGSISTRSGGLPVVMGVVYIAMALIYIAPAVYVYRYASRISALVLQRRDVDLEAALEAQKSFWKFAGIITLIVMGLYAVGFAIAMLVAFLR